MATLTVTLSTWFTVETTVDALPVGCPDPETPSEWLERLLRKMSPEGRLQWMLTAGVIEGSHVHVEPVRGSSDVA